MRCLRRCRAGRSTHNVFASAVSTAFGLSTVMVMREYGLTLKQTRLELRVGLESTV